MPRRRGGPSRPSLAGLRRKCPGDGRAGSRVQGTARPAGRVRRPRRPAGARRGASPGAGGSLRPLGPADAEAETIQDGGLGPGRGRDRDAVQVRVRLCDARQPRDAIDGILLAAHRAVPFENRPVQGGRSAWCPEILASGLDHRSSASVRSSADRSITEIGDEPQRSTRVGPRDRENVRLDRGVRAAAIGCAGQRHDRFATDLQKPAASRRGSRRCGDRDRLAPVQPGRGKRFRRRGVRDRPLALALRERLEPAELLLASFPHGPGEGFVIGEIDEVQERRRGFPFLAHVAAWESAARAGGRPGPGPAARAARCRTGARRRRGCRSGRDSAGTSRRPKAGDGPRVRPAACPGHVPRGLPDRRSLPPEHRPSRSTGLSA